MRWVGRGWEGLVGLDGLNLARALCPYRLFTIFNKQNPLEFSVFYYTEPLSFWVCFRKHKACIWIFKNNFVILPAKITQCHAGEYRCGILKWLAHRMTPEPVETILRSIQNHLNIQYYMNSSLVNNRLDMNSFLVNNRLVVNGTNIFISENRISSACFALITYGSGHETVAVLLPGFAINW